MLELLDPLATAGFFSFAGYCLYSALPKLSNNEVCKPHELKSIFGSGVSLSRNVRLSAEASFEHILFIAPTGAGKSRRFVLPNLLRLEKEKCSIIVTDPSGELEAACHTKKKKYIINPFSDNTFGYDPLKNCKNEFEVRKLARVILTNGMNVYSNSNTNNTSSNQQDFIGMGTPLLSAYMLMNYYTKKYSFIEMIQNICTMPIMSKSVEKSKDGKGLIMSPSIECEIFSSNIKSAIKDFNSFLQVMQSPATLASIRIVMNSSLQLFFDEQLTNMFSKPNIDFSKIRNEESIIFVQIPERHAKYYSPLVGTFLNQLFDSLIDHAKGLKIFCFFDEFANCGVIDNISELLSTIRKRGVSISASLQSLKQLVPLYGQVMADALMDLFGTYVVCGGLKNEEFIVKLIGETEYFENQSTKTKQLVSVDTLRRFTKKKVLIICNGKRPVEDDMLDLVA